MYAACSNLETLPKILATKVLENGLKGMFNGCSKISIKTLPDTTHQTEYRIPYSGSGEGSQQLYMFYNTDTDIPEGTADINTSYFTSNELI